MRHPLNTSACSQKTATRNVETWKYSPSSKYEPILMNNMQIEKKPGNNDLHEKQKIMYRYCNTLVF